MSYFHPQQKRNGVLAALVHIIAIILVICRLSNWFAGILRGDSVPLQLYRQQYSAESHLSGRSIFEKAIHGRSSVRIYVYSLPPKFNSLQVARSRQQPAPIRDPYCDANFYSAEVTIHRKLLASSARTLDPVKADFFYVPLYVTCFLINNHPNNLTKTGMFFEEGMQYVRTMFPFFNASQGRDHVYTFTQGFGARLSGEEWRQWRNGIFLTHNGDFSADEYTPRKDIVVPPDLSAYVKPIYTDNQQQTEGHEHASSSLYHIGQKRQQRDSMILERRRFLAMFGGQSFSSTIADHRGKNYSGGVRQYIASELYKTPGFRVSGTRSDDYLDDIRNSLFCLAPEGWHPWSPRPYYGLLLGCVPVVLSDRQELAFEDSIPYNDIVVWIRPNDVFSLNRILRSISVEEIARRLHVMENIWRLYSYDEKEGAAMDAILSELSRRKYTRPPRRQYWSM